MSYKEKLEALFVLAKEYGIASNQNEFAKLLKTDPSTLSHSLKGDGKYQKTTETLVYRGVSALVDLKVPVPEWSSRSVVIRPHVEQTTENGDNIGGNKVVAPDGALMEALAALRNSQDLEKESQSQIRTLIEMNRSLQDSLLELTKNGRK